MWSHVAIEAARTMRLALASWSRTARLVILIVTISGCLFLISQRMPLITW